MNVDLKKRPEVYVSKQASALLLLGAHNEIIYYIFDCYFKKQITVLYLRAYVSQLVAC